MFEIKAIQMIHKYLPIAVEDPKNPEGRNGMAVAQYVAGMAFSNVGLGVDHGMAHPMSALHDVPHGVACAILLPTVMRFNAPAALDKYVDIAKALDVYRDGMTKEEAADAACTEIENLSRRVGIPAHLSELGITEKDILVHDAHCQDDTLQLKLALMGNGDGFPVALGVIRDVEAPTYDDCVTAQLEEVKAKKPYHTFEELLETNDIWEVK